MRESPVEDNHYPKPLKRRTARRFDEPPRKL